MPPLKPDQQWTLDGLVGEYASGSITPERRALLAQ